MEFNFCLADIFPARISSVDHSLIPKNCPGVSRFGNRSIQVKVSEILDKMGKASAESQRLAQPITSANKMSSNTEDQKVYLMIDFEANQVIGLLKLGKKKLYLHDRTGIQHQVVPTCILDFYIHESRQRSGFGKVLFDTVLETEGLSPQHVAIDRPSDKFIYFLKKHYGLENRMVQANKYVVFDGFFVQNPHCDFVEKKSSIHHFLSSPSYNRVFPSSH